MIDPTISEWLNLIARWIHVFAGIMWVGTTYYFTWLDARLTEEEKALATTGSAAQVWMVHSGGFYVVEKRKIPDELSRKLHWFRWEAGTTWLSGMALLLILFYIGGGSGLIDPDVRDGFIESLKGFSATSSLASYLESNYQGFAMVLGLVMIFLAGFIYDVLMRTPLRKNERAFAVVAYFLLVTMAFGMSHVLGGRALYIHIGAAMGTIMAANVWMHILPSQKRMIAALREGRKPDDNLSAQAKLRSKQNTFMAVPVVFLMISNHFPGVTYGEKYGWLILSGLILVGWIAAKFIRRA